MCVIDESENHTGDKKMDKKQTNEQKIEKHIIKYVEAIDEGFTNFKIEVRKEFISMSYKGRMNGFVFQRLASEGFKINSIDSRSDEVKISFRVPEIMRVLE